MFAGRRGTAKGVQGSTQGQQARACSACIQHVSMSHVPMGCWDSKLSQNSSGVCQLHPGRMHGPLLIVCGGGHGMLLGQGGLGALVVFNPL